MTAPYCPISTTQQKVTTRNPPAVVDVASIPAAHDLKSVITALNQMNNVVQHITRGVPQINNVVIPGVRFISTPPDRNVPQYNRVTWKEMSRDYHEDEIVNPDDEDQKIEIKTVARVIWQEDTTEQRVVYKGRR